MFMWFPVISGDYLCTGCDVEYRTVTKRTKKNNLWTHVIASFGFISVHIQPVTISFCPWQAAKLPMSIIIVGVGQAEFDGENRKQF